MLNIKILAAGALVSLTATFPAAAVAAAPVAATTPAVTAPVAAPAAPRLASANRETTGLPTLGQLRGARLTLADLPDGYRRHRSSDGSNSRSTSSDPECSRLLTALDSGESGNGDAPREAEREFALDHDFGPFVINSLSAWRTTAAPRAGLAVFRRLARTCPRWTEVDPDGTRTTVHLRRLRIPAVGDERVGMRMRLTVHGILTLTARADMAWVRVGSAATMVAVMSLPDFTGAPDVNLASLTRISVARLDQIV